MKTKKPSNFPTVFRTIFTQSALLVGAAFLSVSSAWANQPLFESEEALDAVLTVPLNLIYGEKGRDERPYHQGELTYQAAANAEQSVPVKVKTRGNYRRANCDLPPLRLNFAKRSVKQTLFHGQDKMKLVGPCKPGGIYKDLVGLEFLAYQVFELVSDYALETRAMNLNYVDANQQVKSRTSQAFVIEDISDLAKRKKLKSIEPQTVKRIELDKTESALLEMFALFIANNDYSTLTGMPGDACCHNVALLSQASAKDSPGQQPKILIPVPYDFDMSGLVDAPYAAPPGTLPIRKVRQRYFNGLCKDDAYFIAAADKFRVNKAAIFAMVDGSDMIRGSVKKKTKAFFEKFYDLIDDPKRFQSEVIGRCRGAKA